MSGEVWTGRLALLPALPLPVFWEGHSRRLLLLLRMQRKNEVSVCGSPRAGWVGVEVGDIGHMVSIKGIRCLELVLIGSYL